MHIKTIREERLEKLYKKYDINNLADLSINNISFCFNIRVEYYPFKSRCFHDDNCAMMYLNEEQSMEHIREDFFHELSHFFQHDGDQRNMNPPFKELQEMQAHWFSLYASMPYHILEKYLPAADFELAEIFQLPINMVKDRLSQLKRKDLSVKQAVYTRKKEDIIRTKSYDPNLWTEETWRILTQLKKQTKKEVVNYVGLSRRD